VEVAVGSAAYFRISFVQFFPAGFNSAAVDTFTNPLNAANADLASACCAAVKLAGQGFDAEEVVPLTVPPVVAVFEGRTDTVLGCVGLLLDSPVEALEEWLALTDPEDGRPGVVGVMGANVADVEAEAGGSID